MIQKIKSITTEQYLTAAIIAFITLMAIGCVLAATGHISIEHGEIKIHF
jgi:hypothetical protein